MTRVIEILISLAIVLVLFLVVGLVLPSSRYIEEKVETNRKMTIVYDTLNSFARFKDWNALPARDPKMKMTISGPENGVGAQFEYASEKSDVGKGSWKIVRSESDLIVIQIDNDRQGANKVTQFKLRPTGRGNRNVEITQTYKVDYGMNLLGRYAGLYVRSHVGEDMKFGLGRLTSMLASVPNVDYKVYGLRLAELGTSNLPAEHILFVNAGTIPLRDDLLTKAMRDNVEWLNRAMASNGLVATGKMRIITSEFSGESYTFAVAMPVRRATDADGVAPTEALSGLSFTGTPVKYEFVPARRAASVKFTGSMRELENIHNALRAWSAPRGLEVTDRAFDIYESGIDTMFNPDAQFTAYWPLRG